MWGGVYRLAAYWSKSESSVRAVREMSAKCPPSVRQMSATVWVSHIDVKYIYAMFSLFDVNGLILWRTFGGHLADTSIQAQGPLYGGHLADTWRTHPFRPEAPYMADIWRTLGGHIHSGPWPLIWRTFGGHLADTSKCGGQLADT